jgi:hypothetical protein
VIEKEQVRRLIDYLIKEDAGKVSVSKLGEAFNLDDTARPLKQSGIAELERYQEAQLKELDRVQYGKTPHAVLHLLAFFNSNGHNIDGVFHSTNATKIAV